jgi:hypothetical protein
MVLFDAPTKQTTLIGGLWKGTLTFNEVGVSVGAEVSGSFDTQWVSIDGAPKK